MPVNRIVGAGECALNAPSSAVCARDALQASEVGCKYEIMREWVPLSVTASTTYRFFDALHWSHATDARRRFGLGASRGILFVLSRNLHERMGNACRPAKFEMF